MGNADDTTIRFAVPADVPEILRLIRALAEYEQLLHEVVATETALHEALFGARPAAEALIATRGGLAVGFALFFHNFSTFRGARGLYLEDLYVEPAARGGGLGKRLLQTLAAIALERGCARMEWSVLDWNAPAIGFYRSLGARLLDDWRICRLTDAPLAALAEAGTTPLLKESKR